MHNANILVTGSHRSGTTFVGKVLSMPPPIDIVMEPFSKSIGMPQIDVWFPYIYSGAENEQEMEFLVRELLDGRAKLGARSGVRAARKLLLRQSTSNSANRILLKDPKAALSGEWFAQRFGRQNSRCGTAPCSLRIQSAET